ncbi:MAG: MFS transporter [Acidobacteria bacterium]|nr:MFS transporter [Acidobacteriota bacterium]
MLKQKPNLLLVMLTYAGFFSLGMPDGLLSVAWPSMRASFGLPLNALGSLLTLFTAGYLLSSLLSGWALMRVNVGVLLALSCLATSVSLFGYSIAPSWWILIAFGLLGGLGAGAIDSGLNTYIANFLTARASSWLHACYGVATTSGPALMTAAMASGRSWQFGYAIVATGQLALACCFGISSKLWPSSVAPAETQPPADAAETSHSTIWRLPVVWLSVTVFFVYTGIEAATGTWPYSLFTQSRGASAMEAGTWASLYWGCFTIGRILSGIFANSISTRRLMRLCIAGMAAGAIMLWINVSSLFSFAGVALMGLACAPIFPTMIATTPDRISQRFVASAMGLQISAAVLGQSGLPSLVGVLANKFGLEILPPALLIASAVLFIFSETLFHQSSVIKSLTPSKN